MAKIKLNVSYDMYSYVREHGAKYSRALKGWYIDGEVPNELLNFLPKVDKPRIDTKSIKPLCPICDSDMNLVFNKKNSEEFWSCSRYSRLSSGCLGSLNYDEGVEEIDKRISRIEENFKDSSRNKIKLLEHQGLIVEVAEYAKSFFEDEENAAIWLQTNQVCLSGKVPSSLMLNYEGCLKVKNILERLIELKNQSKQEPKTEEGLLGGDASVLAG